MATGDKFAIPAMAAGFWALDGEIAKGTGDTLNLPAGMVNIGGNGFGYTLAAQTDWDPVAAANDDGTVSPLAIGDDVYVYVVQDASGVAQWLASKNATVPTGYTADTSRKMGGFHYGRTRPTSDAYNAAFTAPVEIIPNSCWDLGHRPKCDPTGFLELGNGTWLSIYLMSEDAGTWPDNTLVSAYNATPVTGTEGYDYMDHLQTLANAGMRLPSLDDMMVAAYGIPQGATGQGGRINTGQTTGYGFDPVSCANLDQPSGNVWQLCQERFDRCTTNGWNDSWTTGKDSTDDRGQWYGCEFKVALFGGYWADAAEAGARCVHLGGAPWDVATGVGVRAACDSL